MIIDGEAIEPLDVVASGRAGVIVFVVRAFGSLFRWFTFGISVGEADGAVGGGGAR